MADISYTAIGAYDENHIVLSIALCDDEVNNLYTFKANLRFDYNVLTTNNIDEVCVNKLIKELE